MSKLTTKTLPPDQAERERALNPANSILVQAPAGSGKTDLLTRRFLCLLAEADEPEQVLAITFSKAAAAEMRNRVLSKLEEAAECTNPGADVDEFAMESLARRALDRSQALGWNLLDQPARLRISTIDSFCRELALQRPMLSGLGDGLDIAEHTGELYRRAARRTLEQLDSPDPALRAAIQELLLWRDNDWREIENQLVEMLKNRDRWMHEFVLSREADWDALRRRLERPFAKAVSAALDRVSRLLGQAPGAADETLRLARFASEHGGGEDARALAEMAEFPAAEFETPDAGDANLLEDAHQAYMALAGFLLTGNHFRKAVIQRHGFPSECKAEKARFRCLVERLRAIPDLGSALAAIRETPPTRYSEADWQILRACFTLLRRAAGELQVVFAEAGKVDYIEVAQIAQSILKGEDGMHSEAALGVADRIRHILVDEFQDTSRRQHELLRRLIAAWEDREGRSCFVVGDPMQSIYFFRDADAELFPRVKAAGLEVPGAEPLLFDSAALSSNFRTARALVQRLNQVFEAVFSANDGSGIAFSAAEPARDEKARLEPCFNLHLNFEPQSTQNTPDQNSDAGAGNAEAASQVAEIVSLIQDHLERIDAARGKGEKYRIAVLGRTHAALAPIAEALHEAGIPFRAVDLEKLGARPEVLDVLALARALLNPLDRVSWLGVLRAPWCGLSLRDVHTLTSADDPELLARPVPDLLAERHSLLSPEGRVAAVRLLDVLADVPAMRFAHPAMSPGAWLEQVWLRLGGAQCVDGAARANLDFLWQALDKLPDGEQDLLGPALSAMLAELTAQADPAAESDWGVQLMTIHKSKGLEFEVVIVPELQAETRKGNFRLLSWLERGLPAEEIAESGEVTEFLIAPLKSKGTDRGRARAWVDRMYLQRETQEMRRLLYVAATRAREELHLFAQPACRQSKDGSWGLVEPKGSLLATAWPALKPEIEERFAEWKRARAAAHAEPTILESIAAEADGNLLEMPAPARPNRLRRLPHDFEKPWSAKIGRGGDAAGIAAVPSDQLYQRHEGGLLSRALGVAVHALLERMAGLHLPAGWDLAGAALAAMQPQAAAQLRAAGIAPQQASRLAAEAIDIVERARRDPLGEWILSPHDDAASEVRWVGIVDGALRSVQVDRIFRAGPKPLADPGDVWWIIDYKTAHSGGAKPEAELARLHEIFAPQLAAYADVLRKLRGGAVQIRAGLYYPRMLKLDWWEF